MGKVKYNDAVAVTPRRAAPKKRSAMSIFRAAAFFGMGGCSPAYSPRKKSARTASPAAGGANSVLKNLVGGMRPLGHLQLDAHDDDIDAPAIYLPPPPPESFYDVLPPPSSPEDEYCISRYASPVDQQALDADDGAEGAPGDGAIDAKAEEFIANFYEQMRLQRCDSVQRHH